MKNDDYLPRIRIDFGPAPPGDDEQRFGVSFYDWLALKATPLWFEWLGWVLVVAAFEYLAVKSRWWFPRVIVVISVMLLWNYFNAFFYRFEFTGLPLVRRRDKLQRLCSAAMSGAVALGAWTAAWGLAKAIGAATP